MSKAYKRIGTNVGSAYEMAKRKKELEAPISTGLTTEVLEDFVKAKLTLQ